LARSTGQTGGKLLMIHNSLKPIAEWGWTKLKHDIVSFVPRAFYLLFLIHPD